MKTKTAVLSSVFCAGFLLGIAPLAQADTYVTFQVDMKYQVQAGTFTNGVNQVYALGSFNNWGNSPYSGLQLTNNPTGPNPNLYTGTTDDTIDANGTNIQWKFTTSNLSFETTQNNNDNRAALLPTNSGSSLVLPVAYFSDAAYDNNPVANNATFQVDMSQQIALGNFNPNTMTVEVWGQFEGWQPGDILTNDPSILRTNQFGVVSSDVYVGTFLMAGSPGQIQEFKYATRPLSGTSTNYETVSTVNGVGPNLNRFCFEGPDSTAGSDQTLPIVYFSDLASIPVVSNTVTFSVDMTVPTMNGFFNPASNTVTLRGAFNGWSTTSTVCTNDPNAGNTNIYSCVVPNVVAGEASLVDFKFGFNPNTINSSYENNPFHTYSGNPGVVVDGGNRAFAMPQYNNGHFTLPTVYYSDQSPYSVLPAPTAVTFNVNMTGAVGTDAHVFNPSTDKVYINGLNMTNSPGYYSFVGWTNAPTGPTWTNAIANFLMTENPIGSSNYTITLTIPAGYPVELTYKYSINGADNEAGYGVNHVRFIRSTGSYTLPTDIFGPSGTIPPEKSFGDLAVGPKSAGNVPITWLGRPGVYLQMRTNLTIGAWMDLPATDAQSSTNYPVGAGASYFRLINPF